MADAASISPKFVPNDKLLPRDNSGGLDWTPHTADWGDGGVVTGPKSYLSAGGGGKSASGNEQPRQKKIID